MQPQHQAAQAQGAENEDPMMRLLSQMMGGGGQDGRGGGGIPPELQNLLNVMGGQGQPQQPPQAAGREYLWRIIHFLTALTLGLYISTTTSFSGSKINRAFSSASEVPPPPNLFYIFATAELVLQSGRFFYERGQLPVAGWLSSIGAFLPEPYAGYVRVWSRYNVIFTTIVADAMVIVFVLGLLAWWKGMA